MIKAKLTLLLAALCIFLSTERSYACGYNYFSSCATQLDIAANGVNTTFFVGNCTFLTNLQNNNFGTVNELSLGKLTQLSWESCTNTVMNAKFYYRVYTTGSTPGNFTQINIPQTALSGAGDYRNRTFEAYQNIDLLAGVPAGIGYTLEVYFSSDVDFNLDNTIDATLVRNNNGTNFKASFKKSGTVGTGGLTVSIPTKNNISCAGYSDGNMTASATGGNAPYTYSWSNGVSGATIQNLAAGTYTVSVTSANGISGTSVATITQPQPLNGNVTTTDETSAAANNGSVTASPTGGTAPFTYQWNTGSTANTIANLDAGTYTVTIKDSRGCQLVQTATVNTAGTTIGNYCAATSSFPWNDWIGQVTLDALNNISDKAPYTNYTNLAAPTLVAGQTYPMTLKTGIGWFPNAVAWRVYIDYNRNGVFDANEIALEAQSNPPVSGLNQLVVNQSFVIPSTALDGITRMRVMIKRGGLPTPCETLPFGEVEDYNVKISATGGGTCPLTASTSNIICNNNGTPTFAGDDTYSFALNVAGSGTGWNTVINGVNVTGSYGAVKNLGPYNISAGALSFTVNDNTDATCRKAVSVTPPSTCSTGGTAIYCNSRADFPWEEWISRVSFAGINNTTGKWYTTDYTSQSGSVIRGQTYPLVVATSYSWNVSAPHVKVWIDYNQDGVFQEPSEVAYSGILSGVANGVQGAPLNGNITIPTTATPGVTRMRVSLRRDGYALPCDVIPYGEVEDYSVNIASAFALVANNDNRFDISAEIAQGYTDVRTVLNVLSPLRNLRLERAGEDMDWKGITLWSDVYLPESELISIKTKDNSPFDGVNHYRFVAVLENGETLYTKVETVVYNKPFDFSIFPNPTAEEVIQVNLEKLMGNDIQLTVMHPTGRAISTEKIDILTEKIVPINISQLPTGEYFLLVRSSKMRPLTKKFVVVHE
jgi:hypothetical protein